ncbi:MAG: flagellar export protein FliJ [Pseudomonadota bacterium]|jgi:flagellar export protein FliJ|nr:MAG: flagellar export protein FliJ [Pseudomonadota bacterium]
MKRARSPSGLDRLLDLREREVERLGADVAARERVSARYRANLARLQELSASTGPSARVAGSDGLVSPAVSRNRGDYRQNVMRLADLHRLDLTLHEADLAVARRALGNAIRRREALRLALERRAERMRRARQTRERKAQDEMASQIWIRGRG